MSVNVTDNTAIVRLDNSRSSNLFLRFFLDDVDRNAEPITPKDQGNLQRDTLKIVSGKKAVFVWNKEYAAPQEVGITRGHVIRNYTTPGTGKDYARRAVAASVANYERIMQRARLI